MTLLNIDASHWPALDQLLDTGLELPPEARAAWIESLGPEHAHLVAPLRTLLAQAAGAETRDFLRTLPNVALRASAGLAVGAAVGPYRLLRELGRGGMASVWLAERADGLISRPVALKLPHHFASWTGLTERMAREREILGALTHPQIARLYDAGLTPDGQPWLALEYVEGETLDAYCRGSSTRAPASIATRLELFAQVGRAVAFAHGKLVIHRDLKPANILVRAEGTVCLLDFGIARLIEDGAAAATPLTELAGPALTLDYAAPEQVRGEVLTTAADIYSLGVLLFELLADRLPHKRGEKSRAAFEQAIQHGIVPAVSTVAPPERRRTLAGDLDTIVAKALKKTPEERYATANALVEDIERYRSGRPVLAQPDSTAYRVRKFVGRHKASVAAAAAASTALVSGASVAIWQAGVAIAERDRAEEVKRFIAGVFRDADPYYASGGHDGGALLRRAGARIDAEFSTRPTLRAELLTVVGASLTGVGDFPAAETTLQRAGVVAGQSSGPTSIATLRARTALADVFNRSREIDKLDAELKAVLPLARALAQEDPEPLVQLLKARADLALEQRDWDAALPYVKESFDVALARLGARHRLTVQVSNLLSETYTLVPALHAEMLAQGDRGLAFARAALGADSNDPLLIYMQTIRVRALGNSGYYHEAIADQRGIIEAMKAAFGPSNLEVANAISAASTWERRVGAMDSALAHHREALEIYDQTVKPESADYKVELVGYGSVLLDARRPAEALVVFERAQAIAEKMFGPKHWESLGPRLFHALAFAHLGEHERAAELLNITAEPDADLRFPVFVAMVRGEIKRLAGDAAGATTDLRRALDGLHEGPIGNWHRLPVLFSLGRAQLAQGDRDAARATLAGARDLADRLGMEVYADYADALTALGRIDLELGAKDEARASLERSNAFWRKSNAKSASAREAATLLTRASRSAGG